MAVGLVVALIDVGLTYATDRLTGDRIIAVTIGFVGGLVSSYLLHATISFSVALAPTTQIPRLLITVIINYLLTLGIVIIANAAIGASTMEGKLLSLPIVAICSYLLSRYWIYSQSDRLGSPLPVNNAK